MMAGRIGGRGRDCYREHGSVAFLPIVGAYRTPMQLDKLAHNGETQSQASSSSVPRLCLPKAFEYVGKEVLIDTRSIVDNLHLDIGPGLLKPDLDFAVFEAEPDRIRKEIPNDFTKAIRITIDALGTRWSFHNEPDPLGISLGPQGVYCRLDERVKIDGPSPQLYRSSHNSGPLEYVVEQPSLQPSVAIDGVDGTRVSVLVEASPDQHSGPGQYCAKRGSQLMRQHREQLISRAILGFLTLRRRFGRAGRRLLLHRLDVRFGRPLTLSRCGLQCPSCLEVVRVILHHSAPNWQKGRPERNRRSVRGELVLSSRNY